MVSFSGVYPSKRATCAITGITFRSCSGGLPGDSLRDKRLQNGKYPTFVFKRGVIRSLWVVVRQP